MRIAIAGGTGFIGQALIERLSSQGAEILIISRSTSRMKDAQSPQKITWEQVLSHPDSLGQLDAIVNLAGASLNQRWTKSAKQAILDSRLTTVRHIAQFISGLSHKPKVVVQSSAVGIYGTSTDETFNEASHVEESDFLSHVTLAWEEAAEAIAQEGVRLVKLRTGVVLGNQGGAFPLMKLPFMLGVGGTVGSGKQWLSWIHIEDMVRLIEFSIEHPDLSGPVNAVAPSPVTNQNFGHAIARRYRRPYWFPLPKLLLQSVLGERATLLLDGQKVLPAKALEAGFPFLYPELDAALANL